jgi:small nuclear ribonucleoprotein (snRNP)-like protein
MTHEILLTSLSTKLQEKIKKEVEVMKRDIKSVKSSLKSSLEYTNTVIEELFEYIEEHQRRYGHTNYVAFNQKVYLFSSPDFKDYEGSITERDFDMLVASEVERQLVETFNTTKTKVQNLWEKLTGKELTVVAEGRSGGWFCIDVSDLLRPFDLEDFRNISVDYVKENDITEKDLQLRADFAKKVLKFLKNQEDLVKRTVRELNEELPVRIEEVVEDFIEQKPLT